MGSLILKGRNQMVTRTKMYTYTRKGDQSVETPYEKPVIVPEQGDMDPGRHAWADARFATDIMTEHGLFFALLMPEELAAKERGEALSFSETFKSLYQKIDGSGPPERSDVRSFVYEVIEAMKP